MARPEAVAIGLYFKTPTHLLRPIAEVLRVGHGKAFSIVDPCAGDGEAIYTLARELFGQPPEGRDVHLYTCEMEETRFDKLKHATHSKGGGWGYRVEHVHGDAMRAQWERESNYGDPPKGASCLFLNPPYDHDPQLKRLEERFLRRFAPCLASCGVLVFLVPFYALAASAETLARHFCNLRCYRFPEGDFEVFKQVVLFAEKRPDLVEPDPAVVAQVMRWSESVEGMPVLGSERYVADLLGHDSYKTGFSSWRIAPLDVRGIVARFQPWHSTDRAGRALPISGVVPPPGDLLARHYPLAVPPKPAHIAAGIASGVFNGARVTPDDPSCAMPALLVKGTFTREFKKVDEKTNKDGEKTGEVQVQQPKLSVTVLDIARGAYHTLAQTAEKSGATTADRMTTGDLLAHYGAGLMRVMLAQCPMMHDPAHDSDRFSLPSCPRTLYRAQDEAVRACVKLLGGPARTEKLPSRGVARLRALRARGSGRAGKAAILMGEIGSGKSTVALATAQTIGAKRILIMCPPHLLDSWKDQAAAVVPWARTMVLGSVADVDAFATAQDPGMAIGILSREAAKLGHAWDGAEGPCPKCGAPSDGTSREDLARKRVRCSSTSLRPKGTIARVARDLAETLMEIAPHAPEVNQLLRGRHRDRIMRRADSTAEKNPDVICARWIAAAPKIRALCERVAYAMLGAGGERVTPIGSALLLLLAALRDDAFAEGLLERVYQATVMDLDDYSAGSRAREVVRDCMLLLREPYALADRLKGLGYHRTTYGYGQSRDTWGDWRTRAEAVTDGRSDPESYRTGLAYEGGKLRIGKVPAGTHACAVKALAELTALGRWTRTRACGEPLFQAVPEPRRVPLANYLVRNHPRAVDLLVADEAHEFGGDGSAQSFAFGRLAALGMPVIALTGSIMNGYAESLFNLLWALDPQFRQEFDRTARSEFVKRYGYIKQLVQRTDADGKVVEWGSVSDRQEVVRTIGNAPGVLPLLLLRYLLRISVTLHKTDLAADIPPCREIVERVEPTSEIRADYERMACALRVQIKKDRSDPLLAGRLFGQMSELPSYLDRATDDTGNAPGGAWEVAYPDSPDLAATAGKVIARSDGLPAYTTILPKEAWMLETVRRELAEGRRCMVFAWHEAVLPRLQRILSEGLGEKVALLLAGKVAAAKRQAWIDREVVNKGVRVAVMNPAAVKTGLNNLIWFSTQVWMQNPGCDPQTYRQAVGRVDRIGQKLPTRVYFPIYGGTAQETAHRLLMHKVGVSLATDGLDAESALQAAGVGESGDFDAFSVGRALFEMMERGDEERPKRVEVVAPVAVPTGTVANEVTSPVRRKPEQLRLF